MSAMDLGIHFGGSSMSIAYSREEKLSIIVNEAGYRSTPSILALNDNEFLVGIPAKQNIIRNSKNTILFTKHFIGKNLNNIDKDLAKRLDCEIKGAKDEISFLVETQEQTLSDAIQKQLKYLIELAKTSLSVRECNAVMSVPCYFTPDQTEFLKMRAQKAGFNVLRMIRDPAAACLAYDLEDDNSKVSNVLVYQMGGNSLEVSLVNITNGLLRIKNSINLQTLGGDAFTGIIIDILCEEFQRKHRANPKENKRSMFKLKASAEELKMILSTMERAHCSIDALYDGQDFDYYLTRQRFENSCNKVYQQILQPIDDLLKANNMTEADIDKVILSGAATKMCRLQALIKQKFTEPKVLSHQSPDEIVSLGCAKQCTLIVNSKYKKTTMHDSLFTCLSNPIYYTIGKSDEKVLLLNEKLPLPIRNTVNIEIDLEQPFVTIFENDKDLVKIKLNDFKTKEVSLMIQLKMNETIEVTAIETSTNERITAFLNSETNIEP